MHRIANALNRAVMKVFYGYATMIAVLGLAGLAVYALMQDNGRSAIFFAVAAIGLRLVSKPLSVFRRSRIWTSLAMLGLGGLAVYAVYFQHDWWDATALITAVLVLRVVGSQLDFPPKQLTMPALTACVGLMVYAGYFQGDYGSWLLFFGLGLAVYCFGHYNLVVALFTMAGLFGAWMWLELWTTIACFTLMGIYMLATVFDELREVEQRQRRALNDA